MLPTFPFLRLRHLIPSPSPPLRQGHLRCLNHRRSLFPQEFDVTVATPRKPKPIPVYVEVAESSTQITKLVAATAGAGMVAVQAARSAVIIRMQTCEPEFEQELDPMSNPFQTTMGTKKYSQYLAAALMNHILIIGIPALQAMGGALFAVAEKKRVSFGFSWIRFPSLASLPLLHFLEPTCYSAMVVTIYAEETWERATGVISLCISFAVVASIFVHLKRTWAAVMVPGQAPNRMARERYAPVADDDSPTFESRAKFWARKSVMQLQHWLDGGVCWKDKPGHKGYCRANRLLFMDFREE